jgi:hypothetical protein
MDTIETGADTTDATATEANILQGLTAYTAAGKVTGTMPNRGAVTFTPSSAEQAIPTGYHEGGKVSAVLFDAAKVLSDTTIAGTQGTMVKKVGTVLTPQNSEQAIPQGYYDGTKESGKVTKGKDYYIMYGSISGGTAGVANSIDISIPFNPSFVVVCAQLNNGTQYRKYYFLIKKDDVSDFYTPASKDGDTTCVQALIVSSNSSTSVTSNPAANYISGNIVRFTYWLDSGYTGTYQCYAFA